MAAPLRQYMALAAILAMAALRSRQAARLISAGLLPLAIMARCPASIAGIRAYAGAVIVRQGIGRYFYNLGILALEQQVQDLALARADKAAKHGNLAKLRRQILHQGRKLLLAIVPRNS